MRVRILFSKSGVLRFIGHLDVQRALERAARRAGLPLKYSQGFSPRAKINLACALPLGFTSQAEVADLWLEHPLPPEEVHDALKRSMPPGLDLLALALVDDTFPSLQSCVRAAVYRITFIEFVPDLEQRVQRIIDAKEITRQKGGKIYDLKPLIVKINPLPQENELGQKLELVLSATEGATGRPDEVLDEMGIALQNAQIHRVALLFESGSQPSKKK